MEAKYKRVKPNLTHNLSALKSDFVQEIERFQEQVNEAEAEHQRNSLEFVSNLPLVRLQATVIHGHDDLDDFIVVGHEKESFNMVAELIALRGVSMTQK